AEIRFVPEAGAAGVFEEVLPPNAMRFGAGPLHEGVEIAPVLAHAEMHGKKRVKEIFVAQEAFGFGGGGLGDLRAEAEKSLDAGNAVDAHAEVDDYEVGIGGEVYGATVYFGWHEFSDGGAGEKDTSERYK